MARPAIDDRSVLATMAENWVANCCKVSIRKLTKGLLTFRDSQIG